MAEHEALTKIATCSIFKATLNAAQCFSMFLTSGALWVAPASLHQLEGAEPAGRLNHHTTVSRAYGGITENERACKLLTLSSDDSIQPWPSQIHLDLVN